MNICCCTRSVNFDMRGLILTVLCAIFYSVGEATVEQCSICLEENRNFKVIIVGARDEFLHCCLQNLNFSLFKKEKKIQVKDSNFTIPKLVAELKNHSETLNIKDIYIKTSHLFEIPRDAFGYFRKIRRLALDGNGIKNLVTESFFNLKELFSLNLSNNSITNIPRRTFCQLPSLELVDLMSNQILSISDDAFYKIPKLTYVYMEDNSLTTINFTMFQNSTVSEIHLSNNNLMAINDDIKHVPGIKVLNLNHNQLTNLSQEISHLKVLTDLKLDHNLWVCDCDHRQMIDMLKQHPAVGDVQCSVPANTSIQTFNKSELQCENTYQGLNHKEQEDDTLTFEILGCVIGGSILVLCAFTSLFCLWKRRKRNMPTRDMSHVSIMPVQLSPCRLVPNSNYSRLFSNSPTVSTSSTTHEKQFKLKVGKLLGRGAFGEVYEGFSGDVEDGEKMVAIKMIRESSSLQNFEALEQEFKQLTQIDKHSYIIQVFSIGKIEGSYVMVMEMAEHGDLLTYLRKIYKREEHVINSLDSSEEKYYLLNDLPCLFSFMWNVAKGMEYLSLLKILHRDLAARNILLCSGPVAKIADFGLSRDVYESGYYYQDTQGRLPYKWLSPEALINGKSSLKSDVWSFGILMWEMVTLGSNPYPGIPPSILVDMYRNSYIMPQPPLCPDDIYAIMQKCWDYCVDTRPHFTRIVEMLDSFIQTAPNVESPLTDEKELDEADHLISDIHIE